MNHPAINRRCQREIGLKACGTKEKAVRASKFLGWQARLWGGYGGRGGGSTETHKAESTRFPGLRWQPHTSGQTAKRRQCGEGSGTPHLESIGATTGKEGRSARHGCIAHRGCRGRLTPPDWGCPTFAYSASRLFTQSRQAAVCSESGLVSTNLAHPASGKLKIG